MKRILIVLLLISLFVNMGCIQASALSAQSAVVIDADSGRILYAQSSEKQMGMASTTKIMTAVCALENASLDKVVTVSPKAYGVEGSSMYLELNEKITMENLLWGLMLVSGNDAATAIAMEISGSEEKFAELMNQTAKKIGATNTHFTNPHGLSDKDHYTTAYDLAKITAYALKNPKFREIVSTRTKNISNGTRDYDRVLVNHNKFLKMYEGCIGVKTGFTKATGRCLVTAVEKNGMTLVCVTLNAPDDWNDHKTMYDNAFSQYLPYNVFVADEVIGTAKVTDAEKETLNLTVPQNICIPLKEGESQNLKIDVKPYENLCAPINVGDPAGIITLTTDDGFCAEFPLVAAENIPQKKKIIKASNEGFLPILQKVFTIWIKTFT